MTSTAESANCTICGVKSDVSHYTTPAHLMALSNLATHSMDQSESLRHAIRKTSKQCRAMCKQLDGLRIHADQQRHVLFHWTGLHGHEGLNLRHGAAMLTPPTKSTPASSSSTSSKTAASSTPSSTSLTSIHAEPCNVLFLNGHGAFAAIPHMFLAGSCTISVFVKFHSFTNDFAKIVHLGCGPDGDNTDALSLYTQNAPLRGLSLALYQDADDDHRIHTRGDCLTVGKWHHIIAMVDYTGVMRLWLDGVLEGCGPSFDHGLDPQSREFNSIGHNLHAAIKDVRIWNIPLDVEDINELETNVKKLYQ